MAKRRKSLSEAASSEIKANFNLEGFKNKKGLTSKAKFKDQEWIPLSECLSRSNFCSWNSNGAYCIA